MKKAEEILEKHGVIDLKLARALDCKVSIGYSTLIAAMQEYRNQQVSDEKVEEICIVCDELICEKEFCADCGLNRAEDRLGILHPVSNEQDKWVKCTDRLPEPNKNVLGVFATGKYKATEIVKLLSDGSGWDLGSRLFVIPSAVTHWQELPTPPQI